MLTQLSTFIRLSVVVFYMPFINHPSNTGRIKLALLTLAIVWTPAVVACAWVTLTWRPKQHIQPRVAMLYDKHFGLSGWARIFTQPHKTHQKKNKNL